MHPTRRLLLALPAGLAAAALPFGRDAAAQAPEGSRLVGAGSVTAGPALRIPLKGVVRSPLLTFQVFAWFTVRNGTAGAEDLLLRVNQYEALYRGSMTPLGGANIALDDGIGWGRCPNNGQVNSAALEATLTTAPVAAAEGATVTRLHATTRGTVYDAKADTTTGYTGVATRLVPAAAEGGLQRPAITAIDLLFRGGLLGGSARVYQVG